MAGYLRDVPGRKCFVPEQWRWNVHRRDETGWGRGWKMEHRRGVWRLRWRRIFRFDGDERRGFSFERFAGLWNSAELQMPRIGRAVWAARIEGRGGFAVSQQWGRNVYGSVEERGSERSRWLLRFERDFLGLQQYGAAGYLCGERFDAQFLVQEFGKRKVSRYRIGIGYGGERGRFGAGVDGNCDWRLSAQGIAVARRDELFGRECEFI